MNTTTFRRRLTRPHVNLNPQPSVNPHVSTAPRPGQGPTTEDHLVRLVRSAIIDAARQPHVRHQPGDRDITKGGYKHVYGDAQDLAEVAVQVLRETLADRLGDILNPPAAPAPTLAQGGVVKTPAPYTIGEQYPAVVVPRHLCEFVMTVDEDETFTEAEWARADAATLAQDDEGPVGLVPEFPAHWASPYFTSMDRCTD